MIIAETPRPRDASCLPYCPAADSNRNRWGLPDGGRQSKTGLELQRSGHVSSGNWGLDVLENDRMSAQ